MIFDVIESSLKAPSRLIPVEALLGQADGSRMPQVQPSLLTKDMAELASRVCPTSALSLVELNGQKLLRLDYGECIGCGRCGALEAFSPAERLTRCGVRRQQLIQYFDFHSRPELRVDEPSVGSMK